MNDTINITSEQLEAAARETILEATSGRGHGSVGIGTGVLIIRQYNGTEYLAELCGPKRNGDRATLLRILSRKGHSFSKDIAKAYAAR